MYSYLEPNNAMEIFRVNDEIYGYLEGCLRLYIWSLGEALMEDFG